MTWMRGAEAVEHCRFLNQISENRCLFEITCSWWVDLLCHITQFEYCVQVNLCGLGTFATSHLLYDSGAVSKRDTIFFHTKGGILSTRSVGPTETDAQTDSTEENKTPKVELIEMNLPWITTTPASNSDIEALSDTLRTATSVSLGKASSYLIVSPATSL